MCGIAGAFASTEEAARRIATSMSAAIAHRGPDADGMHTATFRSGVLVLAHRRLAIRDLSPSGSQPMARGSGVIVYNGELYAVEALRGRLQARGERFTGTSDTEVLIAALAASGPEGLAELDGMYAFGYLDHGRRRLVLARDPLGIKPLYVTRDPRRLAFASEARALVAAGCAGPLTKAAAAAFLATGAVPDDVMAYDGIEALPRGAWRCYDLDAADGPHIVAEGRTPPIDGRAPVRDLANAAAGFRDVFNRSVAAQLASDVPVGVFLSSGLDSAVIAAVVAEVAPRSLAVTVGFPGERAHDEAEEAGTIAARLGLRHEVVRLGPRDVEAGLGAWLGAIDLPTIDGWNTYLVAGATRGVGLKVALSGLGSDELFGGYPSFREVPWLAAAARVGAPFAAAPGVGRLLRRALGPVRGAKLFDLVQASRGEWPEARVALARRRLLADSDLQALGLLDRGREAARIAAALSEAQRLLSTHADTAAAVAAVEATAYMGNTLLRDTDVASMAHGLEVRVPFLGREVASFGMSLSGALRTGRRGPRKAVVRRAFPEALPAELAARPKRGFMLPMGAWLAGPLRDWSETNLEGLRKSGLVDARGVDRVLGGLGSASDATSASRRYALALLGYFLSAKRP